MMKVGITGGIGSGKTIICRVFELLGIPVFYADDAAKNVMQKDKVLINDLKHAFGSATYQDGQLNRKYLSKIVFNNPEQLSLLNSLVHPAVFKAFDEWVIHQQSPYVLKEAALLFESGSYKMCDQTILVEAPQKLRIERVIKRDGISEEDVAARINKQMSDNEKEKYADHILLNDEVKLILPQIIRLHEHFLSLS